MWHYHESDTPTSSRANLHHTDQFYVLFCAQLYMGYISLKIGEIVAREVCFPDTEPCSYKLQVSVVKCVELVESYYVYYFEETPTCYMRYCSQ